MIFLFSKSPFLHNSLSQSLAAFDPFPSRHFGAQHAGHLAQAQLSLPAPAFECVFPHTSLSTAISDILWVQLLKPRFYFLFLSWVSSGPFVSELRAIKPRWAGVMKKSSCVLPLPAFSSLLRVIFLLFIVCPLLVT